jgi:hypothetical protein
LNMSNILPPEPNFNSGGFDDPTFIERYDEPDLLGAEFWQNLRDRYSEAAEVDARQRFEAYRRGPAKAHWPPSAEDLSKIRTILIAAAKSASDQRIIETLPGLFEAAGRMSLTDAAWEYAFAGIPVFPIKPGMKEPLPGTHGFKDATTDLDQIMKWWQEDPTRNIGISPHYIGCCVVECERDSAADVAELAAEGKILPRTCEVRSASGGGHHWFMGRLGTGAKKLAPTIDHRGNGGYVVVPPSVIDERDPKAAKDTTRCGPYRLSVNTPVAVLPAWVAERLNRPTEGREANGDLTAVDLGRLPRALFELANEIIVKDLATHGKPEEGQGSDDRAFKLTAALGDLARDGKRLSAEAVAALLHQKWAPHFDISWLLRKARNGVDKYRQNGAGCDDPAAEFNRYITPDTVEAPSSMPADPFAPRQITTQSMFADGDDWPVAYTACRRQPAPPLVEIIPGLAEKHVVTYLEGLGGLGKSLDALQDAICISAGRTIYGREVLQCASLYLNYEEPNEEMDRRIEGLIEYFDNHDAYRHCYEPIDTSEFHLWQLKEHPRPIITIKADGAIWITHFGNRMLHWLAQRRDRGQHTFVIFDGIIDAICFAGNTRNDDMAARQVIGELDRLALEYEFTAYAILHPSRAGERSGTGSYAPAWSTKPRAIQSFSKINLAGGAVVESTPRSNIGTRRKVTKRSHGPDGEFLDLRYDRGSFQPTVVRCGGEDAIDVAVELALRQANIGAPICRHQGGMTNGIRLTSQHILIGEYRQRAGKPKLGVAHLLDTLKTAEQEGKIVYKPGRSHQQAGYYAC